MSDQIRSFIKRSIFLVTSILLCSSAQARVFTNAEGVTLDADLHSMDGDTITIRRHVDKKLYPLELKAFSKKDQKFILAESAAGRLTKYKYLGIEEATSIAPVEKDPKHFNASTRIDSILANYWKEKGVEPKPFIDDATYLRRSYLKIIGRIPTHAEAVHFLNDENPYKRTQLVDKLLDSPGYVSHNFNLWADVLRARSIGRDGSQHGGIYYVPWIKEQIRNNVPYDTFVKSLLTAEGYPWDNPAVGYYLRDYGMPLDNMSMTAQVFLGTQMQCAQCHDHPTDVWTQKEFYQLSAFTYGMKTGVDINKEVPEIKEVFKYLRDEGIIDQKDPQKRNTGKTVRDFFQPMRYGVVNTNRNLKLPHDYQYDDAKPKSVVEPAVLYGELEDAAQLHDPATRVESYAEWMVSENNERFTKVIANRMWKHAMGKGLIEPVDNLTATSVADIPELMVYLEELMVSLDYDLKQFLRIAYNTRYFQREAVMDNPDLDDDYHMEGPIFERMSAEQIWDSIATLMSPDIDRNIRESYTARNNRNQYSSEQMPAAAKMLETMPTAQLAQHIAKTAEAMQEFETNRTRLYEIRNDPKSKRSEELKKLQKQNRELQEKYNAMMNPAMEADGSGAMMGMSMMASDEAKNKNKDSNGYYKNNIRRASELNSPEYDGHLLQVFGQSDRDLIENSESNGNVIQALFLMNSNQTNQLMAKNSTPVLEARLVKTPEEKLETLYIGFLSRKPTPEETKALIPYFMENPEKARERIIWAMMNTQQFLFIQ
ncbi:MAG: DUF1549 domain-containing protein [Opitutaceae bacterium]